MTIKKLQDTAMNHKIGDQWIEELDGKKHMLKAVSSVDIGACTACDFEGQESKCAGFPNSVCGSNSNSFIIKDLGILNEDGCLPNCWGEYPVIECHSEVVVLWYCRTYGNVRCITAGCSTKQQAIDAWNRRA